MPVHTTTTRNNIIKLSDNNMMLPKPKRSSVRLLRQQEAYRNFLNTKETTPMATATSAKTKSKAANAPVFKSRVGAVTASVWSNTSKDGVVFYSVNIQKSYKDDKDVWHNTDSLNSHDVLCTIKALDKAHDYILEQYAPE